MTDIYRCYIHDVNETFTDGKSHDYCFECGHVWQTEEEWNKDCELLASNLGLSVNYKLTACPLCAHDL